MTEVIDLPPQPITLVCPVCGLKRGLPENWRQLLAQGAPLDWDGNLRCTKDNVVMRPLEQGRPAVADCEHCPQRVPIDGPGTHVDSRLRRCPSCERSVCVVCRLGCPVVAP